MLDAGPHSVIIRNAGGPTLQYFMVISYQKTQGVGKLTLKETLRFLLFLQKQTIALIKIFQMKLSVIKLQFYDIKTFNLE